MAITFVLRCPKGEVRWTPLSGSRTPRVHGGGKNDLHMAEKVNKNDRRAKIVRRPTHKSLPFTTMQAELKSDKPTPSHTHPHPLMGVGFETLETGHKRRADLPCTRYKCFFPIWIIQCQTYPLGNQPLIEQPYGLVEWVGRKSKFLKGTSLCPPRTR